MAYLATSCVMTAVLAGSWRVMCKCENSAGFDFHSDLGHDLIWRSSRQGHKALAVVRLSQRVLCRCDWPEVETGASLSYV
jgi:hypothetical protein